MIIYSAKNKINGKRYIGQTTQVLYKRKSKHKFDAKRYGDKYPLYKAINEDGWDNFEWEVLEELNDNISQEELDERECYWIEYYNSVNEGYNCQVGGQSGYYHTDETKELISKGLNEYWANNENEKKQYIIKNIKGDTKETVSNITQWCIDNDCSLQCMMRVANGWARQHKGYIIEHVDEQLKLNAEENRKRDSKASGTSLRHSTIKMKNRDTGEVVEVSNINLWCKENGLSKSAISLVAKGYRKSHKSW
ncbi:MAG TPA: GIY-YIG nuclease family protein, partial [Massilibacterium sp.]|nr:GIY-YIG nuclease family protein [Massilibacterium sp.]